MLTLYHFPTSTCSQKVRLALAEKKLQWRSCVVTITENEHLSDWYLELNPNGVVPTIVHDGTPIRDSSVINEYLDEVFPDCPLRPADPIARARMREWRQFIDEVPTPAIRYPSVNAMMRKGGTVLADLSKHNSSASDARRTVRRYFHRKLGPEGFSKDEVQTALDQLQMSLERAEDALKTTQWLAGVDFTLADISLMPTLVRMEDLGLEHMWDYLPEVRRWYSRVQDRASFAVAYFEGSRHDYSMLNGATC